MIEFELKFEVNEFPDLSNYNLLKEKHIIDKYFDTPDYKLISTGNFLRNRANKRIDFKLNIGDLTHTFCNETSFEFDNFKPTNSVKQIFENLNISLNQNFNNFEEFVKVNNFVELAVIDKTRKEFLVDDMKVSLDDAKDIGNFIEIEMDFPDGTLFDKEKISNQMKNLLRSKLNVSDFSQVNIGYVELFLKKHNKKAYDLGLFKN